MKKKILFILGAGASMPYGFPSGKGLINEILEFYFNENYEMPPVPPPYQSITIKVSKNIAIKGIHATLHSLTKLSVEEYDGFFHILRKAMPPSIDQFLVNYPEFTQLGKLLISIILGTRENEEYLLRPDYLGSTYTGVWYDYLFNYLLQEYGNGFVKYAGFISYNYDRSLEQFIYNKLKWGQKKTELEIKKIFEEIKILHIHGKLGPLPWENPEKFNTYSDKLLDNMNLEEISESLILLHEKPDDKTIQNANYLINQSAIIYFLGLAYHRDAMLKLKFSASNKVIRGTRIDIRDAEINRIKIYLPRNFRFSSSDFDCREFLRSDALYTNENVPEPIDISALRR